MPIEEECIILISLTWKIHHNSPSTLISTFLASSFIFNFILDILSKFFSFTTVFVFNNSARLGRRNGEKRLERKNIKCRGRWRKKCRGEVRRMKYERIKKREENNWRESEEKCVG